MIALATVTAVALGPGARPARITTASTPAGAAPAPWSAPAKRTGDSIDAQTRGVRGGSERLPESRAAVAAARRFARAFCDYEIGRLQTAALRATTTPELAHRLLDAPPRLPPAWHPERARPGRVDLIDIRAGTALVHIQLRHAGRPSAELLLAVHRDRRGRMRVTDLR
jgi:hypothetical protein